jgi:hypothetical protein
MVDALVEQDGVDDLKVVPDLPVGCRRDRHPGRLRRGVTDMACEAFIEKCFEKTTMAVIEQANVIIGDYAARGFALTFARGATARRWSTWPWTRGHARTCSAIFGNAAQARPFRLRPSSSAKATPIKAAARSGSSSSPAVASRMPPRG